MRANGSYGSWNNHGDPCKATVGASIQAAVSGADTDWHERMQTTGAFEDIEADYRDAINEALPSSVALCGDEFIGPYDPHEDEFDGYARDHCGSLDIPAIVTSIDLSTIVERHDVDNVAA